MRHTGTEVVLWLAICIVMIIEPIQAGGRLLIAHKHGIESFNLEHSFRRPVISHQGDIQAVEPDVERDAIYWTSGNHLDIMSLSLSHVAVPKKIAEGVGNVSSLSLDWITGNLYYADTDGQKIGVVNVKNGHRAGLLSTAPHSPYAVAVDAREGQHYIYWTMHDGLYRMGLDADEPVHLVSQETRKPSKLSIDFESNRVYWTDYTDDSAHIFSANLTGGDPVTLTSDRQSSSLVSPTGIAVVNMNVYWTEKQNKQVFKYSIETQNITTITKLANFGQATDLKFFDTSRKAEAGSTNCSHCEYLCLLSAPSLNSEHSNDHTCRNQDEDIADLEREVVHSQKWVIAFGIAAALVVALGVGVLCYCACKKRRGSYDSME